MTTDDRRDDADRAALLAIMRRFCQVACLLPALEDIDTNDVVQVAELRVILAELAKVRVELDERLKRPS